jgi:hypothetical protein
LEGNLPVAKIWRVPKYLLYPLFFVFILGASTISFADPVERVRVYTRQIEFDYLNWTLDALWVKWQQMALGSVENIPLEKRSEIVLEYLDLVRQIGDLENQVALVYADPSVEDPDTATEMLRLEIEEFQNQRALLAPLAESIFQAQLTDILGDLNISLAGQPLPPVLYHVTPPPNALIVSPRETIQQDANISIVPGMSLDEITALEERLAQEQNVSALVVGIGGVGLYPTMVMQTTDLNWLAEVVAHEWVHNFLTLRPLGISYMNSAELRTINETVAGIAGKEIGQALVAKYYPQFLPPPSPVPDAEQPDPEAEPPSFDFRAEMHTTRVNVDALLEEGKIETAETYMEMRRRFFWDHGYRIRKLNQAYFAFHGAYADSPGGAAGEDPVGAAVRSLRSNSPSLASFLNRVSWMWSFDQLRQAVQATAYLERGS